MASEVLTGSLYGELRRLMDARLNPFAANRTDPHGYRLKEIKRLLVSLRNSSSSVGDLTEVAREVWMTGGPFTSGTTFDTSRGDKVVGTLSAAEQQELKEHLDELVAGIKDEFPELVEEFPGQFPSTSPRG